MTQQLLSSRAYSMLSRWIRIAATLAALLLLAWWIRSAGFDWSQFRQTFALADPWFLILSIALAAGSYVVRAARWQVMLRPIQPDSRFWTILRDTIVGFAAAVILGRAGEFVRPFLIARSQQVPFSSQVAIWFLERLMDLIAVLLFFGAALLQLDPPATAKAGPEIRWVIESGGRLIGLTGLGSLAALIAFRSFSPASAARWTEKLAVLPARVATQLGGFFESFALGMEATRDLGVLFRVFLYTMAEWVTIAACFTAALAAFPATASLGFWDAMVVMGFSSFGSVVQIPGVGGGMQLLAILVLTQVYGIAVEPATAIATMIWAVTLALSVPPGILLAIQSGIGWRDIRPLQRGGLTSKGS